MTQAAACEGQASACFHCGLPVLEAGRWRASVLGALREFCCAGCEAVASTIAAGGFAHYYETRAQPGSKPLQRPPEPAPALSYDDPQALRQFAFASGPNERSATLILDRIRCAACLWLNEQVLRRLPGVLRADVNYTTQRAQVAWDPARIRFSDIVEAVRAVGYDAYPYDPRRQSVLEHGARRKALWRLFVAGFGAMQVMMYAFPAYVDDGAGTLSPGAEQLMRWASLLLTLPVILFSCGPFFSGAWRELRRLRPGMDTPIALGIGAGFTASAWATLRGTGAVYFDSIAMLVFLLLGVRYLELAARQRAARSLDRLARWSPSIALRMKDDAVERIQAHELTSGDKVLVPAGDRVPADGVVEQGRSSVDESLLTGEPVPLAKSPGGSLIAGTLNLEQPLVMRVERAGTETRAAAVARLVERAAASRPRLVAAADRLAHALTWVVLAVAVLAGLHSGNGWVAIAVLVATCPCALALAAPVALTRASGALLARGVALTRASALETLAAATDVVIDKTGTLTAGRFRIVRLDLLGSADETECRALAAGLEAASRHPLARAFEGNGRAVKETRNFPGLGVAGRLDGRCLRIGTEEFCRELAGSPSGFACDASLTPVFLADERGWLAVFLLEDALRPEVPELLAALRSAGLRLHLVSGDHPAAVASMAARLGIADAIGGALPQDKFDHVARLQREARVVAMIGDGLNDAPVLARADVSFAMGAGADAAQRQADLVVMGNSLAEIAAAFRTARRTMRIVRRNFGWALAYNAFALPLAAAGWIGPWEAAVGMAASSFIVVLNALRIAAATPESEAWKASSSSSPSPSPSYS
ncbi:MAG: cadmium-translocating P-type ATPase [Gammaproteobacteria bacterium]|nr:cadmium-translocating P-type ATPase [Gammaproteobacteria bacterium]